jgi:tRNA(Arg) A34 adenosine deaminase TadA
MTVTSKDYKWISLAEKVAAKSSHSKYLMSAVLIRSGSVVSLGLNRQASAKEFTSPHRSMMNLHAEIDALLYVSKKIAKNCTLYVFGKTKSGTRILARPCQTCYKFAKLMGIKRFVYSTKDGIEDNDKTV